MATQRIGPSSRLRVVDAILSGTHEPETSHYELLRAFSRRRDTQASQHGAGQRQLSYTRVWRLSVD